MVQLCNIGIRWLINDRKLVNCIRVRTQRHLSYSHWFLYLTLYQYGSWSEIGETEEFLYWTTSYFSFYSRLNMNNYTWQVKMPCWPI